VPSELPAEFADSADELELDSEPAASEDEELPAEEPEPEIEAPPSEELSGLEELDEIQPSDVAIEDAEVSEPVAIDVEPPEVEVSETEVAEEAEPIAEEPAAPEVKKKEDHLERSRQALASGDTESAAEMYSDMIKRKDSLESVIEDLRIAVDRTPDNADLWQVLGDAYMRDDQTDEAIDAYRKGMEAA
jgi:tetratricopeptide (TPR) repeat protein